MQQLNLLTAAPAKLRITFKVDHQPETISEWWVDVVGPAPGAAAAPHLRARRDDIWAEMRRERPTRWHANGVGGLVRDREAPWIWTCSIGLELETASGFSESRHFDVEIPDGASVAEAKRIVRERLAGAIE